MPQDPSRDDGKETTRGTHATSSPRGERVATGRYGDVDRFAQGMPTPELWRVDLRATAAALDAVEGATARLAPEEVERIGAIRNLAVGRERRAAHIALRFLIERAFGPRWRCVSYTRAPSGRLSLDGAGGAFSLSHAPGVALIGLVAQGAIGVDIEAVRPVKISAQRRSAIETAAEALAWSTPLPEPPAERLVQAWVRLEAVAKAEGCGMGRLLNRIEILHAGRSDVGPADDRGLNAEGPISPSAHGLDVYDLAIGSGLCAAVAMTAGHRSPKVRSLPVTRSELEGLLDFGSEPGAVDR